MQNFKRKTMKLKSKRYFLTISIALLSLVSCDPGHFGKMFIRNDSSYSIELTYSTQTKDTSIIIQPNSVVDVFHLGGLGPGEYYSCCACEFMTISLQPVDTSKELTKDITNTENWILTNPNQKKFINKEITCEFAVEPGDIQ